MYIPNTATVSVIGCRKCDYCTSNSNCGFCYEESDAELAVNGSCLAAQHDMQGNIIFNESAYGRCHPSAIDDSVHWAYGFCPTDYAWMATFGLVLYLMFFAPGRCTGQSVDICHSLSLSLCCFAWRDSFPKYLTRDVQNGFFKFSLVSVRFWERPQVQFGYGFCSVLKKPSVWFGFFCRSVVKYKKKRVSRMHVQRVTEFCCCCNMAGELSYLASTVQY